MVKRVSRLVCGVGINDANYYVSVEGWRCPFYDRWTKIMRRCYSVTWKKRYPTYEGCTVADEWHSFMSFRAWMIEQDWEGKDLDKDILVKNNKVYGPDTCVFVTRETNLFLTDRAAKRGNYPIGVSVQRGRYKSHIGDKGKLKYLGAYSTPEEAHEAWRHAKYSLAVELAEQQTDIRVSKALIERYIVR